MSLSLYEINAAIAECIKTDVETGEIIGIDEEALEALQMLRDEKIENVALWAKNLEAENTAIAAEVKNLQERQRANKTKIEGLRRYLSEALSGDKFKTARVAVSWRKSVQVVLDPLMKIPKAYQRVKVEADKTAIKQALKDGKKVRGAQLVEMNNLQIK